MSKHRFKTNTDLKQISKIYVKENWKKHWPPTRQSMMSLNVDTHTGVKVQLSIHIQGSKTNCRYTYFID